MSVYKRDDGETYSYDFQYRGRRYTGNTEKTTKREAERFEEELRTKLKAERADASKPLSFQQARALYFDEVGQHHTNVDTTLANLAWLEEAIGKRTMLSDITDRLVARLVAKRRGEKARGTEELVSPATVNRTVLEPLSAIMRRAESVWGAKIQRIDWTTHRLPEAQERVREASSDEEGRLLAAQREDYEPAVRFAILTGCRRAEIVDLTWNEVDLVNRMFRVTGKGERSRTIPMTDEVHALLCDQLENKTVSVFSYKARKTRDGRVRGERYPITLEGFKTAWRRSKEEAGVQDFRFHDTRHTAATRLIRATGNLRLAQRLLGHADVTTTTKYAHVTHDDLRAGMEAVAAAKSPTEIPTAKRRRGSK